MSLCYTVEQLLRLRASPLVCKPENFPPLEEWMGPPQDQKQKGLVPPRGRLDDHTNQNEQSQKRPGLLDTHHASKKSSTAPEDIILGPPKTAFASANSRNALKYPSADASEEPPASNKRFSFHERLPRDREVVDGEKREGKYSGTSNRRLGRDDREDWQTSRQQRHYDQEEGDRGQRRNGDKDRPRWDKQSKDQEVGPDTKRLSRDAGRREGRGRFEQPWFRGDKAQDGGDEVTKATTKQHEWRREKGSGRGPEWDRPSKAEQDPEWMDSTVSNEPRQAHTQEEFQRWKESMKAGAEGRDRMPEKQETVEQPEIKKPEPPPMPAFFEVSEVESGMDKFFATYTDRKTSSEQKPAEVKAHRKPRFAALFSPQPEDSPKDSSLVEFTEVIQASSLPTSQATAAPVDANKADQEHFQRVLQMLAGRSSNNTPQFAAPSKPPRDPNNREQLQKAREEPKSPPAELLQEQHEGDAAAERSRGRGSTGINELLSPRPVEPQQRVPREPTPNRDADLLLRLMQQSRIAQDSKDFQAPQPEASGSAAEQSASSRTGTRQIPVKRPATNPPTFFDDPAISQMRRPEQRAVQQRRPPPAFFDEPFFEYLRQANQGPMGNSDSSTPSRAPALPPGMQRPPGFDPMTVPPPGIPNPAARTMNAAYAAGPSMPPTHIMQPPPHQHMPPTQQQQRKYTGEGVGPGYQFGMGPAPGPIPPPSFMNAPPPGFPNMPPIGVRGVGAPHGAQQFADGGNTMLPRHLMDMLASGQRGDGREGGGGGGGGGGGMPGGHYR